MTDTECENIKEMPSMIPYFHIEENVCYQKIPYGTTSEINRFDEWRCDSNNHKKCKLYLKIKAEAIN